MLPTQIDFKIGSERLQYKSYMNTKNDGLVLLLLLEYKPIRKRQHKIKTNQILQFHCWRHIKMENSYPNGKLQSCNNEIENRVKTKTKSEPNLGIS